MLPKTEKIRELTNLLAEEGKTSYQEAYKNQAELFELVGMALTSISRSYRDIMKLAYTFLEDHNYHDTCALIAWITPQLDYPIFESDLSRIKREIEKTNQTVLTEYNPETGI